MGAITMLGVVHVRRRWRVWAAMGVLLGLASGACIAAAAGARRTESAYPRFLAAQNAVDFVADVREAETYAVVPREQVLRLPGVVEASSVVLVPVKLETPSGRELMFPDAYTLFLREGGFGRTLNAVNILEGRQLDDRVADEVVVGALVARRFGIEVGDRLMMSFLDIGQGTDGPRELNALRVVGIGIMPGEMQALAGGNIPAVHFSRALLERHGDLLRSPQISAAYALRLAGGNAGLPALEAAARERGLMVNAFFHQATQTENVQRSTRFQSLFLWLLAALAGLAVAAVLGQALARQALLESDELSTLSALGMSRWQLMVAAVPRALVVAGVAVAVAAAVVIAGSPLTPVGMARMIEPDPGVAVDIVAILVGAVAIVALCLAASLIAHLKAVRASGRAASARAGSGMRVARAATLAARAGASPPMVAGLRFALEPGRGPTAVPVRSTIAGVTLGVAAIVAFATMAGSMTHLIGTPQLAGWPFDIGIAGPPPVVKQMAEKLERSGVVARSTSGNIPSIRVDERVTLDVTLVLDEVLEPTIAEGRAPLGADEIALGRETLSALGKNIGDRVKVQAFDIEDDAAGRTLPPVEMEIVGRVVVPNIGFNLGSAGEGAALTQEGEARISGRDNEEASMFFDLRPGVDPADVAGDLRRQGPDLFVAAANLDGVSGTVSRVPGILILLAGVLALMAAATLTHTLLTSVRRRARDLAILKTIGFVRGQVAATVAWQATTLALLAVALGIPLGIAIARAAWNAVADPLGVVPHVVVPGVIIMLTVPVTVAVANLVSAIPVRAAARARPASVLRSE